MTSTKLLAGLMVLVMLSAAAIVPFASESSDADEMEIIEGVSINPEGINLAAFIPILDNFMQVMQVLQGGTFEVQFDQGAPAGQNSALLKQKLKDMNLSMSDATIDQITNYIGLMPAMMLSSPYFAAAGDVEINGGSIRTAVDFPEYLLKTLMGDTDDPAEIYRNSESGFLMDDLETELLVVATEDIKSSGMFITSMISDISDGLGPISSIFRNIVVTNNADVVGGVDVNISKDTQYIARSSVDDLAVYLSFKLETNYGDSDSPYFNYVISLQTVGSIELELTKVPGTGEGPDTIEAELDFNNLDFGLQLGFSDTASPSGPGIIFGIDRLKFDLDYSVEVDGHEEKANVQNSSTMAMVNGFSIDLKNDTGEGETAITAVPVATDPDSIPDSIGTSTEFGDIVKTANARSTVNKDFDPSLQYTIGAILAVLGAIIVVSVLVVKKY